MLFAVEATKRWETTDPDQQSGVRPHALDENDAARLWDVSLAMLRS